MVDENFKEQVRLRLDIVSLISEYIPLIKRGRNHFGCCPFHHEKTPSFSVNGGHGYFHCFGCGKSGDIFAFYMYIEGASFPEALKALAAKAGLEMPHEGPVDPAAEALRKRQELAQGLLLKAKDFYVKNLAAPAGQRVCDYLRQRHFIQKTWEQFELGYAGDRLELPEYLKLSTAEEIDLALEIGLLGRNEAGELYNPFALRLMIPIKDAYGHMIGFGGRALGGVNSAKYLNSPQSFIFDKGHHLFGYNLAKSEAIKRQELLLVEGYMDVMACFQMGYPAAVAALGTSVTETHAENISKLKCRMILGLDSDAAGTNAMLRSAELLIKHQINVTVASWPAKDPGELLGTPALFQQAVGGARHVCAHVIDLATASLDGSVEQVVAAVERIGPLLDALPAGLQRDLYLSMAAEKLHLGAEQLQRALHDCREKRRHEVKKSKNSEASVRQNVSAQPSPPPPPPKPRPPKPLELRVVKEIIARKGLWCYIGELVPQLTDERLGRFLTEIANKEAIPTSEEAVLLLEDINLARNLLDMAEITKSVSSSEEQDERVLLDLRSSLQEYNLKQDLVELQAAIDRAQKVGDEAAVAELLIKKKELRSSFQKIKESRRKLN